MAPVRVRYATKVFECGRRADGCCRMTVLYVFLPIGGGRATVPPSNFDVCVNAAGKRHGAVLVPPYFMFPAAI